MFYYTESREVLSKAPLLAEALSGFSRAARLAPEREFLITLRRYRRGFTLRGFDEGHDNVRN